MSECIFATDMARHMNDLNELKALVEAIPSGTPVLTPGLEIEEQERRRKKLLELTLHASDISNHARPRSA